MSEVKFVDTNVLVYAYDQNAPEKRRVAMKLVEQGWGKPGSLAISVQVLQELHVNLERHGVSRADASQIVQDLAQWPVVDNSLPLLLAALNEQSRWQISLWDALILAAARASGAAELISEDFGPGRDYDGVRVVNPF